MKKVINIMAKTLNAAILLSMTATGAFYYQEVSAKEYVNALSEDEKHCLQQNIFFEARDQSTLGQAAVAWVTLNRVESSKYPNSICEVVWQNKQFSWTHDGKKDYPSDNVLEQQAWEKAGHVKEAVLIDWAMGKKSPIGSATHYHADYVDPYWTDAYDRVAKIDSHIFYE